MKDTPGAGRAWMGFGKGTGCMTRQCRRGSRDAGGWASSGNPCLCGIHACKHFNFGIYLLI